MIRPTWLLAVVAVMVPAWPCASAADGTAPATDIAAPAATRPATESVEEEEPDPARQRQQEQRRIEDETRQYPTTRAAGIDQVLSLTIEKENLVLRTTLPPSDVQTRLEVKGMPGVMTVVATGAGGPKPYVPEQFNFTHYDFSRPGSIVSITQVLASPGQLQIARGAESATEMLNVQLIQSGIYVMEEGEQDRIRLFIQKNNKLANQDDVRRTLAAKDFVELRRKYPNETAVYLEPIFRDLGQLNVLFAVDERAAWQALSGAYQAPDDVKQKVQQLVRQLDSDDPKQREQASHALEEMGQPAAMVLMNEDRAQLSEEQSSRIDAFLAPYKPLSDDEAAAARKSPSFLILALAADDENLRAAALRQLKTVVDKPVKFDVHADRHSRLVALIHLRDELAPPATQPAAGGDATNPAPDTSSPPQP